VKRETAFSPEAQVKAMMNVAAGQLKPPSHVQLREQDLPFWDGVLRARARDEWIEADLVVAAQLARCQADIEVEQQFLYAEGSLLENARGTQVMNPRVTVLEQLSRREMALMRTLRMGGIARGEVRDQVNKRSLERQARKVREELTDEDELLA
jgi:hypothetical protein